MTKEEAKKMGATHTNGNSYYMYEQYYENEKGFWYRWVKTKNAWVEILNKPKDIKPL